MKHISIIVALLSCTTAVIGQSNPKDSIPYAELVFYRSYIPWMNAPLKKIPIYINGSLVNELKANRLWSKKIAPTDKLRIAIDAKGETTVLLPVQSDSLYYFKCEVVRGLWFGKPTFRLVSRDIGKLESEGLKPEIKK